MALNAQMWMNVTTLPHVIKVCSVSISRVLFFVSAHPAMSKMIRGVMNLMSVRLGWISVETSPYVRITQEVINASADKVIREMASPA